MILPFYFFKYNILYYIIGMVMKEVIDKAVEKILLN